MSMIPQPLLENIYVRWGISSGDSNQIESQAPPLICWVNLFLWVFNLLPLEKDAFDVDFVYHDDPQGAIASIIRDSSMDIYRLS
jgi:hypothetical protein